MKYTFEAYKEDGSPRKFAGTFRPPYEEVFEMLKNNGNLMFYTTSQYMIDFTKQWNGGQFDKPLYEDEDD